MLRVLRDAPSPLGVREIGRRTGLSPAAVQRLLNTLGAFGYVDQDQASRRYGVGVATVPLAQAFLRQDRLVARAELALQQIADDRAWNGFLGVLRDGRAVYLAVVQSRGPIAIRATPGETMPLHSTAIGKVLLAGLDDAADAAAIGSAPLSRVTDHTITDAGRLLEQVRTVRSLGYATALDENIAGVVSVGAPIRDSSNRVVAAISVAFPRAQSPAQAIANVADVVVGAAKAISRDLGAPETRPQLEGTDAAQ